MTVNVVILDDSRLSLKVHEQMLALMETGYQIKVNPFTDSEEALKYIKSYPVDIVLSDYMMPKITGTQILRTIKSDPVLKEIIVIIITSVTRKDLVLECLELGATDFLQKPIEKVEFLPKMRNLIELAVSKKLLKNKVLLLGDEVAKATRTIKERESEIIHRLAVAAEYRDQETGNHIHRVSEYSRLIAKKLGLDEVMQELIEKASPLHDIGKIAVPDTVLLKPDKLTEKEWITMRNHTLYGYKILYDPKIELLRMAAEIALYHHEKWDGSGYPYGKKGEEIPLPARITSIADVFDAWTSERRYKKAWTLEKAFAALEEEKGKSFDPRLIELFTREADAVRDIFIRLKD